MFSSISDVDVTGKLEEIEFKTYHGPAETAEESPSFYMDSPDNFVQKSTSVKPSIITELNRTPGKVPIVTADLT